jgi:thioesterase domain-containing protein/acyl carrier protein
MFSGLLGLSKEKVDIDKSFYLQGGDSIKTLQLLNTIRKKFNVNIPIAALFNENGSVIQITKLIEKIRGGATMTPHNNSITSTSLFDYSNALVTLQLGKKDTMPLFFIHPVGGTVFCYQKLIDSLDKNQTCYGIQYPIDENKHNSHLPNSIQELATHYLALIRLAQPKGPYAIIGHSFGGMLSYEIAHQLSNAGEKIAMLAIFDTWVVGVLDKQRKLKLKRDIIQKYQDQYELIFTEDPMAETRFVHMQNIGFSYQPPVFSGVIDLFKAETQLPELLDIQDETNFWSKFANVNTIKANGDHDSMLNEDNAKQLAKQLTSCITSKKL